MPKALCDELRWRIVWQHLFREESAKQVAQNLYVSVKTVKRISDLFIRSGGVSPAKHRHGPCRKLSEQEQLTVLDCLLAKPGIYLEEVQLDLFEKTGTWISKSTICREAKRMGLTRKKIGKIALQRSDVARATFMVQVEHMDSSMFLWVDETGSDRRNTLRKYAYSLRGITPLNYCLYQSGRRISAISAMSTRGIEDVYLTESGVNGDTFCDFVVKCILPILQPFNGSNSRSIVVMDNASIHHVNQVMHLINGAGALLWFLPPYSPDLNPIEEVFSEVKSYLQNNSIVYRLTEYPRLILHAAFASVTQAHCLKYIEHAGYKIV